MRTLSEINQLLAAIEGELQRLDAHRVELLAQVASLKQERAALLEAQAAQGPLALSGAVTNRSSQEAKVALFRRLFRGREDVYARRFESLKTGKKGYQPVCRNEWVSGVCEKPERAATIAASASTCPSPTMWCATISWGWIRRIGLAATSPWASIPCCPTRPVGSWPPTSTKRRGWRMRARFWRHARLTGFRPLWSDRARVMVGTAGSSSLNPFRQRWRGKMGAFLLTQTMERRPEIGLDSYDRFFPSQDTLPKGGLGNLIALPLQRKPRENGNSLFLDANGSPYPDQWAFLSSLRRMARQEVEAVVSAAEAQGDVLGVRIPVTDENDDRPWMLPPSGKHKDPPVSGPLPERLDLVLGNQIYVPKADLSPSLRNRLIRLAAFQNPEFYQAQAMRLSTFGKPRIISCCADYAKHLGLPRVVSTNCSTCSRRTRSRRRSTTSVWPASRSRSHSTGPCVRSNNRPPTLCCGMTWASWRLRRLSARPSSGPI